MGTFETIVALAPDEEPGAHFLAKNSSEPSPVSGGAGRPDRVELRRRRSA
jgi:hypothetical protein